ncbi:50S ribosomal protein L4 [Bacteroidetes bacterium endosymbiont of Geopemphigus sp.]|uniref:50S ribosomal protein L4 n=1 Tax=Bacteroidetes bacterium endosymbiont of Geopemphigus sp. TaxID=2047937 RepID=UPI000CD15B1F|nr:50S ribosomal protein L4 [Bacteroidetes bacterium endosymbiont of Geopemphigus sp.]
MEVAVFDSKGKATGRNVLLDASIFEVEPHDHVVYLEIKRYLASQRQGTHKAKERSKLSGSTRKLHRQKGTGGSRKGDINNPLFRGGARVFGPKPRSYDQKLNKSSRMLAKKSILSQKLKDNALKVVEDFSFEQPKTKDFVNMLRSLESYNKKTLFVLAELNKSLYLSSRNLHGKKITTVNELSSYDLMNASHLIFSESAVRKIQENLKK